ncbi:MFS general substrate transporter [Neoconidiobolus thromboides FSU 785]|nr:MFS general substrate transporter [Neoconidiobolus thromboides FSU 785]
MTPYRDNDVQTEETIEPNRNSTSTISSDEDIEDSTLGYKNQFTGEYIPNYLVTTNKELAGFYAIGISNNPYLMIGLSLAIPILLETYAAKAGLNIDGKTACDTSKIGYQCILPIAGFYITSSAFSLFTMALSVLLQAIFFIALSSLADYGNYRKSLLLLSSFIGSISMILLSFITSFKLYWLLAVLSIICNVSYGVSTVFFYAYITTLTRFHPKTVAALAIGDQNHYLKVKDEVANSISSKVSIYGFVSSFITMLLCGMLVVVYYNEKKAETQIYLLKIICLICGILWLIGILFQLILLKKREGGKIPKDQNIILFSFSELVNTMKQVKKLPNTFFYLLSWMLLSDATSSIGMVGILFSKVELGMNIKQLMFIIILVSLCGIIGIYLWLFIQRIFELRTKTMLIIITSLYILLPLYGIIGIFTDKFGLHYQNEAIIFSSFYGFLSGALNSYSRVQYSELIPLNRENQFFGLYEITDNGSSWIGPFIIGIISSQTNNLRFGFLFILPMLLLSITLLLFVNINKGIDDVLYFSNQDSYLQLNDNDYTLNNNNNMNHMNNNEEDINNNNTNYTNNNQNSYSLWDQEDNDPDFYEPNNFNLSIYKHPNNNDNNNDNSNKLDNNDSIINNPSELEHNTIIDPWKNNQLK